MHNNIRASIKLNCFKETDSLGKIFELGLSDLFEIFIRNINLLRSSHEIAFTALPAILNHVFTSFFVTLKKIILTIITSLLL